MAASKYDEFDKMYADRCKSVFSNVEEPVRNAFYTFAQTLMDQTHINRYELLDKIQEFSSVYSLEAFPNWNTFHEFAFNHRPYNSLSFI